MCSRKRQNTRIMTMQILNPNNMDRLHVFNSLLLIANSLHRSFGSTVFYRVLYVPTNLIFSLHASIIRVNVIANLQ